MLTRRSGATAIHPGDGRQERGRVPWRSDQVGHPSHRSHAVWEEVRTCSQLEDEDCLTRVV